MSVVVSDENSLDDLVLELEQVVVNAIADSANEVPDTVFHSVGPPPFDCCPMLAFHVPLLAPEITSPQAPAMSTGRQASYQRINMAAINVVILRCVPTVTKTSMPSTTEMNEATEIVRRDGWVLWNAIMHAIRNGVFKDMCADIHLDRAVAIPEQGGCAGWRLFIRVELGGIPNPGPGT